MEGLASLRTIPKLSFPPISSSTRRSKFLSRRLNFGPSMDASFRSQGLNDNGRSRFPKNNSQAFLSTHFLVYSEVQVSFQNVEFWPFNGCFFPITRFERQWKVSLP